MGKETDRLRKLLDERGVKYEHYREPRHTWYTSPTLGRIYIFENQNGWLFIRHDSLTSEQVIDVTLGRTAKAVMVSNGATGHCKCGGCGKFIDPWDKYCRHCGVRLEVER